MTAYQTEEEQIAILKRFVAKFGTPILVAFIIVALGLFGYRTWQGKQRQYAEEASTLYQTLLVKSVAQTDSEEARSVSKKLREDYAKSPYAALAAMIDAKNNVERKELPEAKANLEWAVANVRDPELKVIATLRLVRVLAATKDTDGALKLLDKTTDESFKGRVAELRGDIFVGLGKTADAKKAYDDALANYQFPEAKMIVEMKLNDLPAVASATTTSPAATTVPATPAETTTTAAPAETTTTAAPASPAAPAPKEGSAS